MRLAIITLLLTAFAAADEKIEPRAIIDFFYPQNMHGKNIFPNGVDVDYSRRYYESWSKRTYLIRDTVVLTGAPVLELLAVIKNCTEGKDTHGFSGHDARYAVTILNGTDKPFVSTFSFLSDTWIRKDNGDINRANITKPKELEETLLRLDPSKEKKLQRQSLPDFPRLKNRP